MHRTSSLAAAIAVTGLLTLPAGALAAQSFVSAGPIKVKGYELTLSATDNGASDSVYISAYKRSGKSLQSHSWSTSKVAVTVKGAKATIKGNLGVFGKLNAKITTGAKTKSKVPAGCKGTPGSARRGKLTGSSRLVLDKTYFKTVALKSVNAMIIKGGKLTCSGSTPGGGGGSTQKGLTLTGTDSGPGGMLSVSITKQGSKVTQQVYRMDKQVAGVMVFHMITTTAGGSALTTAGDLSSATATAVGPYLSGTLSFAGEAFGGMASGELSGNFAAKFDSIGTQSLPAGTTGMLMQQ